LFTGLHHFNLIVRDKEKTKAFYNGILGLEIALETVIEDAEFSRGVGIEKTRVLATFFKLPNNSGLIETFQYENPPGAPIPAAAKANDGSWQHICFAVDDIEQNVPRARSQGHPVSFHPGHHREGSSLFRGSALLLFPRPRS
jgi:catechol 2,3-dioxygenase-like lactoylglutathione lyase family enzyme